MISNWFANVEQFGFYILFGIIDKTYRFMHIINERSQKIVLFLNETFGGIYSK